MVINMSIEDDWKMMSDHERIKFIADTKEERKELLKEAKIKCYSDHNEDIRTKGSCDYCGGTKPE